MMRGFYGDDKFGRTGRLIEMITPTLAAVYVDGEVRKGAVFTGRLSSIEERYGPLTPDDGLSVQQHVEMERTASHNIGECDCHLYGDEISLKFDKDICPHELETMYWDCQRCLIEGGFADKSALHRVLNLHYATNDGSCGDPDCCGTDGEEPDFCANCRYEWPCPTYVAIKGEGDL